MADLPTSLKPYPRTLLHGNPWLNCTSPNHTPHVAAANLGGRHQKGCCSKILRVRLRCLKKMNGAISFQKTTSCHHSKNGVITNLAPSKLVTTFCKTCPLCDARTLEGMSNAWVQFPWFTPLLSIITRILGHVTLQQVLCYFPVVTAAQGGAKGHMVGTYLSLFDRLLLQA